MAKGIRVRKPGVGTVIFESTGRITKILGSFATNSAGSITVPEFSQGTPMCFVMPQAAAAESYAILPRVWISGNTLNWNYPYTGGPWTPITVIIQYGVF